MFAINFLILSIWSAKYSVFYDSIFCLFQFNPSYDMFTILMWYNFSHCLTLNMPYVYINDRHCPQKQFESIMRFSWFRYISFFFLLVLFVVIDCCVLFCRMYHIDELSEEGECEHRSASIVRRASFTKSNKMGDWDRSNRSGMEKKPFRSSTKTRKRWTTIHIEKRKE